MATKVIRGDWTDGRGYIDNLNRSPHLRVDLDGGKLTDAETGETLHCRQYGGDCPIITNGVWEFRPDEAELIRLNLVPVQMNMIAD